MVDLAGLVVLATCYLYTLQQRGKERDREDRARERDSEPSSEGSVPAGWGEYE